MALVAEEEASEVEEVVIVVVEVDLEVEEVVIVVVEVDLEVDVAALVEVSLIKCYKKSIFRSWKRKFLKCKLMYRI